MMDVDGKEFILNPQQQFRLKPETWHSITALEDSVIMEISTYDSPSDTVRMPGRESKFVGWRICKNPEKCIKNL